jgi:hypothetical protein
MKRSKTDYRGGAALSLRTPRLELVVTTDRGPRVVSFRAARGGGENLFIEFPEDAPRAHGLALLGGHRLWHAPEAIPRTYQPDDLPLAVRPLPAGVALCQPVEPLTGLEKGMRIEAVGAGTVRVTHSLTNRGTWPVETAPWALTMLRPGGYAVLPLPPKGSHAAGDLLPGGALIPWTYTDLSLPLWQFHRDFIGIDVRRAKAAQKLGLTAYPGWSAYWLDGQVFVKHARLIAGAVYPDLGSAFEVFTNGAVIELETLGPVVRLEPGRSTTHIEHWTILTGVSRPDSPAAFARLAGRVGAWMKDL